MTPCVYFAIRGKIIDLSVNIKNCALSGPGEILVPYCNFNSYQLQFKNRSEMFFNILLTEHYSRS